ncbi:MAG TPA: hypothetical protein DCE78_09570 [Bacteroidetes bacterium]|nr:hypothetical protein [Bacteroidota bacterium]
MNTKEYASKTLNPFRLIVGIVAVLFIVSCSSTKEMSPETVISENGTDLANETAGIKLSDYVIKPELAFFSIENSIPEVFQIQRTQTASNPNSGFRVQIISTQDVNEAELVRIEFNNWMNVEVDDYEANAYILFRQPYYKLHVGDFKSRANAIEFSRVLKRKFPDAWVVFDDIDPSNITVRKNRN